MSNASWQIPLSGDLSPVSPETQNRNALTAMQVQQARQQMAGQNALKKILSDPNAIDGTTGLPTPNALKSVMAIDPQAGMAFQQGILKTKDQQLQLMDDQIKISGSLVSQVGEPAMIAYQDAKDKGLPDADALRIGQVAYTQGYEAVRQGGAVPKSIMDGVPSSFDPTRVRGNLMKYADIVKQHEDAQKQARADRKEDFQEEEAGKRDERADARMGQMAAALGARNESGGTLVTLKDKDGKDVPAFVEKDGSVKPVQLPEGATFGGKVGSGSSAAQISDDSADLIADEVLAGNRMALTGLARSPANISKVNDKIAEKAKAQGLTGADLAAAQASFASTMSGERAVGTRSANMEIAANEVKNMAPLALSASEKVDRTEYPTLNKIIQAAEKGTGDENVVRFGLAANSLVYTYAKFLNPNGIPTDADKAKAADILDTAWSKGQFSTAVDQIKKEIASGQSGVASTKQGLKDEISGKKPTPEPPSDDDGWTVTKVK